MRTKKLSPGVAAVTGFFNVLQAERSQKNSQSVNTLWMTKNRGQAMPVAKSEQLNECCVSLV